MYISHESTSPAQLFGGIWTQITDRFIRLANDVESGGSDEVVLTVAQLANHKHGQVCNYGSISSSNTFYKKDYNGDASTNSTIAQGCTTLDTGSNSAHGNMPAYQNIYVWRRTA